MKRPCFRSASLNECLREDMLAAMLLHVVESPRSIDNSGDILARFERASWLDQVVDDVSFIFEHIGNRSAAQRTGIVRLTAARRIEGGLVKNNAVAPLRWPNLYNGRREVEQAGILEVLSLSWFHN